MSLLKKFIEFAMGNFLVLIIGFISSPIITRIISPEEMGKFSIFNTITSLLLIFITLGVDQSYVRFYFEEEEECRSSLLRKCVKITLISNIFVSICMIVLYKPISYFVIEKKSIIIVLLIILHLNWSIISRFALLQIRMKQRGKLYSTLNVVLKLSYLVFVGLLYILFKNNYNTLVIATILSNIVITVMAVAIERKDWFQNNKSKLKVSRKEILKFGIPVAFSMAITWIFQSIDRVTIKEICGYSELGYYTGAMNIIALLNAVQGAFTTFWTPVALEHYSTNPKK